jgi:hypothetical protein
MDRKATNLPSSPPPAPPFPPGTLLRYVVLHHTGIPPEHFDLLLEPPGQPLLTWRIESPSASWSPATPATRQPDHRPLYMTYEGEVSNNRGRVKRVATGTAKVLAALTHDFKFLHVELSGSVQTTLHLPL